MVTTQRLFQNSISRMLGRMDTMSALDLFVRTVDGQSFSEAARQLRMTPSAVSRCIARLESELGTRLLQRSTHAVSLTEDGRALYERAIHIVADYHQARAELESRSKGPRGTLRVDAPLGFGRLVIGPLLPRFLARYPELSVELTLRDVAIDPIAESVDLLLRVGDVSDGSLSLRKLGAGKMVVCGAPGYLRKHGTPRSVSELAQHQCLVFLRGTKPRSWVYADGGERKEWVPRGRLCSDNAELLRDGAVAGLGLVYLLDFMVRDQVAEGKLRVVLDQLSLERPLYALWPLQRVPSAKVRAFVDFLAHALRAR
jgi:DNA-binding transcriptional LysR family regulator